MANFNKSFNFRNGVQVDNDNFIVNANGLVGIGTTIPKDYILNVYGDTRVTGLVTANNLYTVNSVTAGISTVGFLTASQGISVSGVVTATSFSGSASGLTDIYAIAVDGWYVDGGFISTTSNVGLGTTIPGASLNVVPTSTGIAGLFSGSTSSDMVRITQTGTGNALVVEDSTNPDSTPLIIDANGNIGIGTNITNGNKLSLYNSTLQISNSTSTYSGLTFSYQPIVDESYIVSYFKPLNIVSYNSDVIISSDDVIIYSNRVGIGSTQPTAKLDVNGSLNVSGVSTISVNSSSDALRITQTGTGNALVVEDSANPDSSPFVVNSSGWVGVGETNPKSLLHVTGTILSDAHSITVPFTPRSIFINQLVSYGQIGVVGPNASTLGQFVISQYSTDASSSNQSAFLINSSGNAGIGSSFPKAKLDVNGSLNVSGVSTISVNSSSDALRITQTGTGNALVVEDETNPDSTPFVVNSSGQVGLGTINPTSDFQLRKASGSLLEVVSDSGEARISVGQSIGVGNSSAVLRFGNSDKTFDIINNDTGNINHYLHAGSAGINTGRFDWIYGQTNFELMSLTYDGSLGLGKTNPDNTLHVVGTSTVTGNAWFGNNVTVKGTLSVTALNSSSEFTGQLNGNVYASSGVSTFSKIETTSNITLSSGSSIGIGTTSPISELDIREGTGLFANLGISSSVGFDTHAPRSIFDFGNVGSATTRPVIVFPNISASTINGIGQTPTGAMIFNTDTLKFQGYTGTDWVDFHS